MSVSFRIVFSFLFLLLGIHTYPQRKLLLSLDTILVPPNYYLEENIPVSTDLEIEPNQLEHEKIEAVLFKAINNWRNAKRKAAFRVHSKLDRLAKVYVSNNKYYKFKNTKLNGLRLTKYLSRAPKYTPLDFKFMEGLILLMPVVDYKKGQYYYHEGYDASPFDLYHGKHDKKKEDKVKPVLPINYQEFAERCISMISSSKYGAYLRSKSYELLSVKVEASEKNKFKKKVPQVKMLILFGAYQNKFLLEE